MAMAMRSADVAPLDAVRALYSSRGALYAQALLHGQLAGIEWQEEKKRLLKMLAFTLLGFASLLCALLFAGGLALIATWGTGYRTPTLATLVVLFGFCTVAAWRRFQTLAAQGGQSFAASREELAVDAALLRASA